MRPPGVLSLCRRVADRGSLTGNIDSTGRKIIKYRKTKWEPIEEWRLVSSMTTTTATRTTITKWRKRHLEISVKLQNNDAFATAINGYKCSICIIYTHTELATRRSFSCNTGSSKVSTPQRPLLLLLAVLTAAVSSFAPDTVQPSRALVAAEACRWGLAATHQKSHRNGCW